MMLRDAEGAFGFDGPGGCNTRNEYISTRLLFEFHLRVGHKPSLRVNDSGDTFIFLGLDDSLPACRYHYLLLGVAAPRACSIRGRSFGSLFARHHHTKIVINSREVFRPPVAAGIGII